MLYEHSESYYQVQKFCASQIIVLMQLYILYVITKSSSAVCYQHGKKHSNTARR